MPRTASPRFQRFGFTAALLACAFVVSHEATAQQTLYRNSLSANQNTLGNASGWSTSSTASGVTPTSVTSADTLTFSNWWTPGQISTAVWLDAADSSTFTLSGSTVNQWNDKSGNARNATIPLTSAGPTRTTQSGMPVVYFGGTSQALGIPAGAPASNGGIFGVFNSTSTGSSGAGLININSPDTDNPEIRVGMGTAGSLNASYWGGAYALLTDAASYQTRAVQGQTFTAASGTITTTLFTNGSSLVSASQAGTWNSGSGEFTLGAYLRVGEYREGSVQELVTLQSAISTTDRQVLEGYLAWKWGLQASLPSNHPYKSAAPLSASDTVYLDGDTSAAGLVFSGAGSATTLLGGTSGGPAANTMTVGSGGITQSAGAGVTTLGASSGGTVSLVVGADQSWTNDSASLLRVFNGISRSSGDSTSRTLTVAGSGDTRLDGSIANGGSGGSLGLTKSGAGALVLAGSNTFTGDTTVSAGRLSVNGALGNTAVTVASAAELGGSGSIVGSLAILAGGTLAPGNSIDSLAGGATSFAAGATFGYEVNSSLLGSLGTAADLLVVSGSLSIAPGSLLTFADITSGGVQPFIEDTTVFAMINYTGGWNGGLFTYGGNELADGERFSVGSQQWQIDYDYAYNTASPTTIRPANFQSDYLPSSGTQTFVAITAVPEPSTSCMALAGLACGGHLLFQRKRASSGKDCS